MDVIKNRKIPYGLSLGFIILGLIMLVVNGGLNYGIEFSGGTSIQIKIGRTITVDEAREVMDAYDEDASIVHIGREQDEVIIKSTNDFTNTETDEIVDGFMEKFDIEEREVQTESFVSTMGNEIKRRALLSSLVAAVAMLIYITWRFELRFAISAIVALVHDVLITLSIYSIFQIPADSAFIAAVLTIIGYSINDTIVIFDRIREELRLNPRKPVEDIINGSIKKSMTRTIYTSATTLTAIAVLYIVGVEDIKVLALPLFFGMISGTYSSLFIAGPVWNWLNSIEKLKTNKA